MNSHEFSSYCSFSLSSSGRTTICLQSLRDQVEIPLVDFGNLNRLFSSIFLHSIISDPLPPKSIRTVSPGCVEGSLLICVITLPESDKRGMSL